MSVEHQVYVLTRIYIRNEKAYAFYSRMTEEAKRYCLGYDFYRTMKKEKEKAENRMKRAIQRYLSLQHVEDSDSE
jgi:hypothetical protein